MASSASPCVRTHRTRERKSHTHTLRWWEPGESTHHEIVDGCHSIRLWSTIALQLLQKRRVEVDGKPWDRWRGKNIDPSWNPGAYLSRRNPRWLEGTREQTG